MRIEDELRGALDVSAPPPTTRLEEVLARGRRRVAVRRAGIAAGVLAVVAVVGIGVVAWPFAGPRLPRVANPASWALASAAPGQVTNPPRRNLACQGIVARAPILATDGEDLSAHQMRTWRDLTQSVLPDRKVDSKHPEQAEVEGTKVFTVDVQVAQGTGSVRFSTVRFEGSPAAAADTALWVTGACDPPRRTTMSDGTVFQFYDDGPNPRAQSLYVFRSDGRAFRLDQVGIGDAGSGGTLPLTEVELAQLGAAVAEVS